MTSLEGAPPPARRAVALLVFVLVALVPWGPSTPRASATHAPHYCDPYDGRSTFVEFTTPDGEAILYIHDRTSYVGFDCYIPCIDRSEGTWVFMENGLESGLQTGGDAIVPTMNEMGSDDPCPEQPTSDDVLFSVWEENLL